MGAIAGETMRLTTRRGSVLVTARADRAVSENTIFLPFAYVEAAANILTNSALDPYGKIPEFKFSAARIEKAENSYRSRIGCAQKYYLITPIFIRYRETKMSVKSDIEIAREANKMPIQEIGAKLDIPSEHLLPYGHDKSKVSAEFIKAQAGKEDGKLILVTAINPTPAGEGKTTTTVGLGDGLNSIGKKAAICIREASLGPCFGMKGVPQAAAMRKLCPWKR